jgi:hypothetical protein
MAQQISAMLETPQVGGGQRPGGDDSVKPAHAIGRAT